MNKWFEFKSDNDCKHAEGLYENCPFCRIESLKQELASYMESDANLRKKVEELEAESIKLHVVYEEAVNQLAESMVTHTALEDAIEVLADQMENEGPTNRTWYIELRALLDSINNPDSDSKVSTLIEQEPTPPPATDDGDSSAGGVGS